MLQRFLTGFLYVIRGYRKSKQVSGLKLWIVIPFIIDCLLLFFGFSAGIAVVKQAAAATAIWILGGATTGYTEFLYYPILALFALGFVALLIYVVYVVASIISSPFFSFIAEKILVQNQQLPDQPLQVGRLLKTAISLFIVSIKRGLLLLVIGVALFILSFIPGLNLLAAYLAFVILAIDSAEFSFEAKELKLSERINEVKARLPEFLGMGAFVALTALIPGLILLVMPYAVIGAADILYPRKSQ